MKAASAALQQHLTGETTTLSRLWKITRMDGTVLRFTDFDKDVAFNDGAAQVVNSLPHSGSGLTITSASIVAAASQTTFYLSSYETATAPSGWTAVSVGESWFFSRTSAGTLSATQTAPSGTPTWCNLIATFPSTGTPTVASSYPLNFTAGTVSVNIGSVTTGQAVIIAVPVPINFQPLFTTLNISDTAGNVYTTITTNTTTPYNTQVYLAYCLGAKGGSSLVLTLTLGNFSLTSAPDGLIYVFDGFATDSVYTSLEDGITASATQYASDGSPDNLTITGFLADDGINEHDVHAHLFDNATVEIRVVNWADLTQGCLKLLGGVVGDVKLNNGAYEFDCRGLAQRLSTQLGSNYGPCCRAELFDGGIAGNPANRWKCRLNRADWVQTSSVVSSPDTLTIVPASGLKMRGSATPTVAAGAGWFADGVITFTSGVLEDYSFEIASWDGITLTLFAGAPLPFSPSASDTFEIEPGCDKTKPTCQGKFSNIVNFAGEAEIPGLLVIAAQGVPQI